MRTLVGIILVLSLGVGAIPASAKSEKAPQPPKEVVPSRDAPLGSIARQLHLKLRMMRHAEGTLSSALKHNREEWESLSPEQRDYYRRRVLAFLRKDPDQQERLLKRYEKLIKMSAEKRKAYRKRARWLKVVVESFTPQEREELQKAAPKVRAQRLLQRKAELIEQGKLKPDKTPGEKRLKKSDKKRPKHSVKKPTIPAPALSDKSKPTSTTSPAK